MPAHWNRREKIMRTLSLNQMTGILLATLMLAIGWISPAQAAPPKGYYWSLFFDFDQSWNGELTIDVGPWVNGELASVEESSTTTVRCEPVGNVVLESGDAVFDGSSYLTCEMDLAQLVLKNHGLVLPGPESYGSMVMRARVNAQAPGAAPLFQHQDAQYWLDFSPSQDVTLHTELWNNAGAVNALVPMLTIHNWYTYTFKYSCSLAGLCATYLWAGGQQQSIPGPGGATRFTTSSTTFTIGGDGSTFLTGRISALGLDPGNFGH